MLEIKEYVKQQKELLKKEIEGLPSKPIFVIVQVGNVEASNRYVRNKIKDCGEVGIDARLLKFEETITEEELINELNKLNNADSVIAYLVQFPLPKHINESHVTANIAPMKDADGFTNNGITNPATPQGIITFLERQNYNFTNKNALVIGRSNIVGKPAARILLEHDCNVFQIHSKTSQTYKEWLLNSVDLVICATGHIGTIKCSDFFPIKRNTIVFDVGINFNEEGKLVGDCEPHLPVEYQSPVPGGVGLLTRLQLLENILKLYYCNKGESHGI